MATAAHARTPMHLWIVGFLALLWNCFGAYDYLMTRLHNMDYIAKSMPGVDPNAAVAWVEGMPLFAQFGWGLGVWAGVLGSVLLLIRSRYCAWVFAASLIGIILSIGYQLVAAPPLPGAAAGANNVIPYVVIGIGAVLFAYANAMAQKAVLR